MCYFSTKNWAIKLGCVVHLKFVENFFFFQTNYFAQNQLAKYSPVQSNGYLGTHLMIAEKVTHMLVIPSVAVNQKAIGKLAT